MKIIFDKAYSRVTIRVHVFSGIIDLFCNAMFKYEQNVCNWLEEIEKDYLSCDSDDTDAKSDTNIDVNENSSSLRTNNFL